MPQERDTRRLSAILAADVVGYSRLTAADERGTLTRFRAHRIELIDPTIATHNGRLVKTTGDGFLVEFASVVDAVECAVEWQRRMAQRNGDVAVDKRIDFRIGINLGDVVAEGDDILGDGVNIAARLEGIAEPGGITISRIARDSIRDKLPYTLDDLGEIEVKNIPRPVRAFRVRIDGMTAAKPTAKRAVAWQMPAMAAGLAIVAVAAGLALWRPWSAQVAVPQVAQSASISAATETEPVIAVLAFDNLSGSPDQEYFSDGISEDIITALAQFSTLRVIGRNSTFQYKGKSQNLQQIGRDLGAAFVLEGSVRRDSDRLRLTAQLIKTDSGTHLWAERYDRSMTDVFSVQDELVQRVVGSVAVKVREYQANKAAVKPPTSLSAYDLILLGRSVRARGGRDNTLKARQLFEQAADIDPTYAPAFYQLASIYNTFLVTAYTGEFGTQQMAERVVATAARALELAPDWAGAHAIYAASLTLSRRFDEAIAEAERALAINPNEVEILPTITVALSRSGLPEKGLQLQRRLAELDPFSANGATNANVLARMYIAVRQYDNAIATARSCIAKAPDALACHSNLAIALAQSGRMDEAREAIQALLKVNPSYTIHQEIDPQRMRYRNQETVDRYADGLRKAGLPE